MKPELLNDLTDDVPSGLKVVVIGIGGSMPITLVERYPNLCLP